MSRALWQRWCAGPYAPRRRASGYPAMSALRVLDAMGWWAIPFILIDIPALIIFFYIFA